MKKMVARFYSNLIGTLLFFSLAHLLSCTNAVPDIESLSLKSDASFSAKFRQAPANGRVFYQITEPIFIDVLDANGDLNTKNSFSITLSIPGTTTAYNSSATNGTAEFNHSYFFETSGNYTLTSTLNSTSTPSSSFKIITTALSWGRNENGELGYSSLSSADQTRPVLINTENGGDPFALSFVDISAGGYNNGTNTYAHTCGVTATDKAYCWGSNSDGQLGSNILAIVGGQINSPTLVSDSILFTQISAGALHTCGISKTDSNAYCWGKNDKGQLGEFNAVGTNSSTPILVSASTSISTRIKFNQISAGTHHTCGISVTNNNAYCWGSNYFGQLGVNTIPLSSAPLPVNGGYTFAQISAGSYHTCGITLDNKTYCWGSSSHGQLGSHTIPIDLANPNANNPAPTLVSINSIDSIFFKQISAGLNHTCGITLDNKTYCWGDDTFGQLGNDSNYTSSNIPTLIEMPATIAFIQISAGNKSTCGITTDYNTYCWGFNSNGQLGSGTTYTRIPTPTPVLSPSDASWSGGTQLKLNKISVGYNHAVGIIGVPGL